MNEEIHVLIYGNVQGVGFRAKTKRCADQLQIAGFVRNLTQSGVEICIQCTETRAKELISQLLHCFPGFTYTFSKRPIQTHFTNFTIQM